MDDISTAKRRALYVAVAALCTEIEFGGAERAAIETLVEMLQSYLSEVGRSARQYTELSARSVGNLNDIRMALMEMGADLSSLETYSRRPKRMKVNDQGADLSKMVKYSLAKERENEIREKSAQATAITPLKVGVRRPHPDYVPAYLPEFPDSHTFVKTPAYKKPCSDYQELRRKAADQKKNIEKALTKFASKTRNSKTLSYQGNLSTFLLIDPEPSPYPYFHALRPKKDDGASNAIDEEVTADFEVDEEAKQRGDKDMASSGGTDVEKERSELKNPYLRPPRKTDSFNFN